jgi:hypothetical protein
VSEVLGINVIEVSEVLDEILTEVSEVLGETDTEVLRYLITYLRKCLRNSVELLSNFLR